MNIFNFAIILDNKQKFFKLFCRGIIKNINKLPFDDQMLKNGLKDELRKSVYFSPRDKYSSPYKYRIKKKELMEGYYYLFEVYQLMKRANSIYSMNKREKKELINIVYYFYYTLYERAKEIKSNELFSDIPEVLGKKRFKVNFSDLKAILLSRNYFNEALNFAKFEDKIRDNILYQIEEKNNAVYKKVFGVIQVTLPQYMKAEHGYDYEEIKKIKEELNLYDIENTLDIINDIHFPKSIEEYYEKMPFQDERKHAKKKNKQKL